MSLDRQDMRASPPLLILIRKNTSDSLTHLSRWELARFASVLFTSICTTNDRFQFNGGFLIMQDIFVTCKRQPTSLISRSDGLDSCDVVKACFSPLLLSLGSIFALVSSSEQSSWAWLNYTADVAASSWPQRSVNWQGIALTTRTAHDDCMQLSIGLHTTIYTSGIIISRAQGTSGECVDPAKLNEVIERTLPKKILTYIKGRIWRAFYKFWYLFKKRLST